MNKKLTRALISVSNKTGIIELASALVENNIEIIASNGTASILTDAGIEVIKVEQITGTPSILDGRVKTLHPKIHGAILADLDNLEHISVLKELEISPINLVVANFYDIQQFDIGGPSLIRAAVKNSKHVAVLTNPDQYPNFINQLSDGFDQNQRDIWARIALLYVVNYDLAILNSKSQTLRYGENPHQRAALVGDKLIAGAKILGGKPMSFNNYLDVDCAWKVVSNFISPTIAIVKHTSPCGVATAQKISDAFNQAKLSDSTSAFGGVIASNHEINSIVAQKIVENFYEVIIAPNFTSDAIEILKNRQNLRVVQIIAQNPAELEFKQIMGGILFQTTDQIDQEGDDINNWKLVSGREVSIQTKNDLSFAWRVAKDVKSNAIVIARNLATVGIGMGQTNRVDSVKQAIERAGVRSKGAVIASDGFFPFADSIELIKKAEISAIVQPGGSIKDSEVIKACIDAEISMYLTGVRHFLH